MALFVKAITMRPTKATNKIKATMSVQQTFFLDIGFSLGYIREDKNMNYNEQLSVDKHRILEE